MRNELTVFRRRAAVAVFIGSMCLCGAAQAQGPGFAAGHGGDRQRRRNPEARQRAVAKLAQAERERRAAAEVIARRRGLPIRGKYPGGGGFELAGFEGDMPLYRTTLNVNAGISTGANLLWPLPYGVTGAGFTVGVWDQAAIRTTHQEFGGRATVRDGVVELSAHATHVAGTIGAAGVDAAAKGMAPAAYVDCYDWNDYMSEMRSRGASYPGESGMIYISNHSYGYNVGWVDTGTPKYTWYGSGWTAAGYEDDFGKYNKIALDTDSLAYSLPYYLIFWAAGNDRANNPANSNSVALFPGGTEVSYDAALHPPGDGVYKNGFDTISYNGVAKNVLTVGAVSDAVSGGVRAPNLITSTLSFSSWGPTDDGRVKPDLVANGYKLKSTSPSADNDYASMSGTSMASPNAAGTAQLLVSYLATLFANTAMRASTLKALLIHTADDLGNPGPDYKFGWGLVNAKAAADLLAAYHTNAIARGIVEDRVTSTRKSVDIPFTWDGVSPIRATLCWTDPAGSYTTAHDSRVVRLVNNLDLRIIAPDSSVHQPWVMPFVGDWSVASCDYNATTGSNYTDNVEQVLIATPGVDGVYVARVTYAGTLTNEEQAFSLVISGGMAGGAAAPPTIVTSSPQSGSGTQHLTVVGDNLMFGADVFLRRFGQPNVKGASVEVQGDLLLADFNTTGMAEGWWHMTVANPDGRRAALYNAFVVGTWALWTEDFETADIAAKGWTVDVASGTNQWWLSTVKSVSPNRSMFSPGPDSTYDVALVSPPIPVPAAGNNFSLSFWHDYSFASNDGGVLEFSIDGGGWFDVTTAGSGTEFTQNGYDGSVSGTGQPNNRNPLVQLLGTRSAWTGGSGGFKQTVVAITDTAKYAGKSLRVRWRLGTNNDGMGDEGWYVDDIVFSGVGDPPDMTKGSIFSVH